jgi:hypothetical protein
MKRLNLQTIKQAAISTVLLAPAVVFANTDPFTTAMSDSTTKVGTYAAALVGLAAVAVGFMIAIKYVKKIVKAS